MVCTAITITKAPTLSASDVGFGVYRDYLDADCTVPIDDVASRLMNIVAMVTANIDCVADATIGYKLNGVPAGSDMVWYTRFNAGTEKWAFNSGYYYVVGVYTVPTVTFSNITAI